MMFTARRPLLISILFAMLTTALGYKLLQQAIVPVKEPSISIIVAANDIPPLTRIEDKDLALVKVSPDTAKKISFFQKENDLVGKTTVNRVDQGLPLRKSDLLEEQQGNPFQLPNGYRAVTVANSPTSGVGGYLKAGHYVDIIWNYEEGGVKKTLLALQNIRVLAVGSLADSQVSGGNSETTITFLLKANDALNLSYMSTNGSLTFMLRPSSIDPILKNSPLISTAQVIE